MQILTVLTFVIAFLLILWGYLVGVKGRSLLIPGYTPERVQNKQGHVLWIGYNLMVMGTLGIIDGVFQAVFPLTYLAMFLAYAVVIIPILSVRIITGKKRYEVH